MNFVDTGAWFAAFVPDDPQHHRAVDWMDGNTDRLVTSDYVVDELLTLLRVRGHPKRALLVGEEIFRGELAVLEWTTPEDVQEAWGVFRDFSDKAWSFTDCVSKVLMNRLEVTTAFSFDRHFLQFGSVRVVPEPT